MFKKLLRIIPDLKEIDNMIGLEILKKNLIYQILYFVMELRGNEMMHIMITGDPGVGKTTIATLLSKIYLSLGILESDTFISPRRSDLIAEYLGQTAVKTNRLLESAKGGVVFIDEAYSLGDKQGRDSFSRECINAINQFLSTNTDTLCIIAGYEKDLQNNFFKMNAGLERRFPWKYNIVNYNPKELSEIFQYQIKKIEWNYNFSNIIEFFTKNKEYFVHNGGDTEVFLVKCKICHAKRLFSEENIEKSKKF